MARTLPKKIPGLIIYPHTRLQSRQTIDGGLIPDLRVFVCFMTYTPRIKNDNSAITYKSEIKAENAHSQFTAGYVLTNLSIFLRGGIK
jgi:hypothetical protein